MSDKAMARILQLAHERHTDSPDPLCPRCVEEWRTLRAQLVEANKRIEVLEAENAKLLADAGDYSGQWDRVTKENRSEEL